MKIFILTAILSFFNPTEDWITIKTEEAILIEAQLKEYHDDVNDVHLEYYQIKLTNLTAEDTEVEYELVYTQNGIDKTTNHDGTAKVKIPANSSVVGDYATSRHLTLFHKYLPGNSGKVASETVYTGKTVNIISKTN